MKRTPRQTAVKANALTSPKARRVSLCRAGANQTPLNSAKSESVVVEKKELDTMLTSMKAQGFGIASIAFTGDNWNRAAVDGWMSAGGYEGYTLEGTDGAYTAKADIADDAEGERRTVKTEEGVSVTLFKAPVEDATAKDDGAEGDPAEGAASDVQPVAKSEDAVLDIVARAKSAFVGEARTKSLYTVSEFASLIRDLKWLVNDMTYDTLWDGETPDPSREALIADLKSIGSQLLTAFAALVNIEVADMADAFKSATEDTMTDTTKTDIGAPIVDTPTEAIAPVVTDSGTPADEPKGDEPKADEPKADEAAKDAGAAPADTAAVADTAKSDEPAPAAADAAPAWFTAFADKITSTVKSLTERVDANDAASAEKASDPGTTTVDVPAQKSADASEQPSGSTTEKSDGMTRFEQARFKSALGL